MKPTERKISILANVAMVFLIAIFLMGCMTYIFEALLAGDSVTKQTERYASEIADEVEFTMEEYPAYPWLMEYWYRHPDTMDIEYDAAMDKETRTAEKCRTFSQRHPDLLLDYLTKEECDALPAEDQKLYAEIVYSQVLSRVNEIKQAYHVDYLFCVISEEPFDHQFFVYSGAQPGAVRGTGPDDAYVLGVKVDVSVSQAAAMRSAIQKSTNLANAGDYVDYYEYIGSFDEHSIFIGLTYGLSELRADISKQTDIGMKMAILFEIALALICLLLLFVFLLRPLKNIQQSIRSYSETKDSAAACEALSQIKVHNELGQLSEDVADLTREIDAYTAHIMEITSEKERIETELDLAKRIQTSMLPGIFPPYPDRTDFSIHASMEPAKEVGGDFYDFFFIDDDHLCMVMADVSGKGIPAALFMMASKIILSHHAKAGKTPAQILADTNEDIIGNNSMEMFVTVWIGILELSTGKLTAANAGHEYPVWKQPDGGFELLKDKHGFVIGGMRGMKYTEYELMMEPGSKLFLYTDGVPEATNAGKEMFGTDQMIEALNEAADADPEKILRQVRSAVDSFVEDAEQFDDLTMLCLEYKGL